MLFSKIARQIIVLIPFIIVLFNSSLKEEAVSFARSAPFIWKQQDIVILAFVYLIMLVFYSFLYGLILGLADLFIAWFLTWRGCRAVRKGNTKRALVSVRSEYKWNRIYGFLNLVQVVSMPVNENDVWKGLNKGNLTKSLFEVFKFLAGFPVILSFLLSCVSLKILEFREIQNFLMRPFDIKIDVLDLLSKLPLLVTLMALVPTIFFFYFYSRKRDIQKIIDKEESKNLEEAVLLYRELSLWIEKNLCKVAENYNYVMGIQRLIVEMSLMRRASNYQNLKNSRDYRLFEISNYNFKDIPEIHDFVEIVNGLLSEKLDSSAQEIASRNYCIWILYWKLISLNSLELANHYFYTRAGVVKRISNKPGFLQNFTEETLDEMRDKESADFASNIYMNLKMLYVLKRGSEALRKYLYPTRTERILIQIFLPPK